MAITDADRHVPARLVTDELLLRWITEDDAADDFEAVMDSRDDLRLWRRSTWPEDGFTLAEDREDVASTAARTRARRAFDYTVRDLADSTCLGCVYVFPPTAGFLARSTITPLSSDAWDDVDAAVYLWTRRSRLAEGADARLLEAMRTWFAEEWGLERVVVVVSDRFEHQRALVLGLGMTPRFEIGSEEEPAAFVAYA